MDRFNKLHCAGCLDFFRRLKLFFVLASVLWYFHTLMALVTLSMLAFVVADQTNPRLYEPAELVV